MTNESPTADSTGTYWQAATPHGARNNPCAACTVRPFAMCGALEDSDLDRLNAISGTVTAEASQAIVYEGDTADYVFNVLSGVVRLTKMMSDGRRQITGFLFPGDFLGLSVKGMYACSAEAVTGVSLCRFARSRLTTLYKDRPELEHRLLDMASDELARTQDQILLLGRKTARERVVSFLLLLSDQAERIDQPGNPVDLPMSRSDIADYLGLTIETVSRTMTGLAKDGLITLPNAHRAVLEDKAALEAIASGDDGLS